MRTTLTLDDDVAAAVERRRQSHNHSLKQEINELLRVGLLHADQKPAARSRFRVKPLEIGECLVENFDNVAEVLAIAEGEDYR